jgi:HK97 gp10 family phage protein
MNTELMQAIKISKDLQKIAKGVSEKERKRIYRAAAKPLIQQARANAPKDSGLLRRSIKELPIARRQDAIYVGPKLSKTSKKKQPFYAHWIEYGKEGFEGVRYMQRAYESTKLAVLEAVQLGLINKYKSAIKGVSDR